MARRMSRGSSSIPSRATLLSSGRPVHRSEGGDGIHRTAGAALNQQRVHRKMELRTSELLSNGKGVLEIEVVYEAQTHRHDADGMDGQHGIVIPGGHDLL